MRIERHEGLIEGAIGVGAITADAVTDVRSGQPAVVAVQAAVSVRQRPVQSSGPLSQAELDAVITPIRFGIRWAPVAIRHYRVDGKARVADVIHLAVLGDRAGVLNGAVEAFARVAGFECERGPDRPISAEH